jgi:hypothetical protein
MANKNVSRADVMIYFTGSDDRKREPSLLQDLEKIELYKGFENAVPSERRRDLVTLIERMCGLPTYALAKDVAQHFGSGGFFAQIGFTTNLTLMVEGGALINPVGAVFGLSPKLLQQFGLLDEFLDRADNCTAAGVWLWVRNEIRTLEATQMQMKQAGINPWK